MLIIRWLMTDEHVRALALKFKILSSITVRLSRQDIEKKFKEKHIDVSPLALGVMRILAHKVHTIGELGKHMIISPASLVPIIETLVEKGYIKKENDSKDRRKSTLHVTPKAKSLLKRYPLITEDDVLLKSLKKIGEKKSRELVTILEELLTELSTVY